MLEALGFFALMEAAGLAAAPLAALVLGRLPGAGLGFAKVLGVLLVGWLVWMAGSLGIADYGPATIVGAFARRGRARARSPRGGCARLGAAAARSAPEPPRGRLAPLAPRRGSPRRRCPPRTRCGGGCGSARRSCSPSRSPRWRC